MDAVPSSRLASVIWQALKRRTSGYASCSRVGLLPVLDLRKVAVPFTPASGPRLLVCDGRRDLKAALAKGALRLLDEYQLSSAHINFLPEQDLFGN